MSPAADELRIQGRVSVRNGAGLAPALSKRGRGRRPRSFPRAFAPSAIMRARSPGLSVRLFAPFSGEVGRWLGYRGEEGGTRMSARGDKKQDVEWLVKVFGSFYYNGGDRAVLKVGMKYN